MRQRLREESALHVLAAMHKAALSGDVRAAQLVLERCLPAMRPGDDPVDVPVAAGGTLAQQAEAITSKMLAGEISPSEATDMLAALAHVSKIIEVTELQTRMAELERLLQGPQHG